MPKSSRPKIAIVYDRVNKIGGAEKVLMALHELYSDAPLYTSVFDPKTALWARDFKVIPSFIQKVPFARNHHEWFAWAMPVVFESFNFDDFDIVVSVTSAEAKGIITKPETLHICYLLTPTRYLWSHTHFYQTGNYATNKNFFTRSLTPLFFSRLRQWDQIAATRPDQIVAISKTTARRSGKYYRRHVNAVIYPPVSAEIDDVDTAVETPRNFYLLVSRLVPYKRIDLAVKAFNQLGKNLIVIGDGAQKKYLKKLAKDNVKILGRIGQARLARYYQKTKALIFPAEEDFGIVCLEAQAFGKPVVAYARGGAAETIKNGHTGILFKEQSVEALIKAINRLESTSFEPEKCRQNAAHFSKNRFKREFNKYLEAQWLKHKKALK